VPRATIEQEIERLQSLDLGALRCQWRRLYHSAPPRLSRDLFILALGYKLQEVERGGLSKSLRRKLETAARSPPAKGEQRPAASPRLKQKSQPRNRLQETCRPPVAQKPGKTVSARNASHHATA
jgi:hypothetical protein